MIKALIITYYWPPAGGPGVQRWLKFATYLKENGITPVVYVPENPSYAIVDVNIDQEIPEGIEIISQPIKEPYKIAKYFSKSSTKQMSRGILPDKDPSLLERFMLFVRGNFFIPDARVGWVKPSIAYLTNYLKEKPVDVVITTGPPHSVHLIGQGIKQNLGVKWIVDFRDPWTTIGYHSKLKLSKKAAVKHKELEWQVLNKADQIIVTSPTTKKEFKAISPIPIAVITNGYDARAESGNISLDTSFSIAHVGSFLTNRNPKVLWEVLSELSLEIDSFKNDLQLVFAGYVSNSVLKSIDDHNLSKTVLNKGYVSHSEAITFQKKSQLLLLTEIDSDETKCIIPGKLFEYFMAKRPIIAIGPKGSDIEDLIVNTATGRFFDFSQKASLKGYIENCYSQFKAGMLAVEPIGVEQYSRQNLTKSLAQLIKQQISIKD